MSDYDADEFFEQAMLSACLPSAALDSVTKILNGNPLSDENLRNIARAESRYAVIYAEEMTRARRAALNQGEDEG